MRNKKPRRITATGRYFTLLAALALLAVWLAACGGEDSDAASDKRMQALEETVRRLEDRIGVLETAIAGYEASAPGESQGYAAALAADVEQMERSIESGAVSLGEIAIAVAELEGSTETGVTLLGEIASAVEALGGALELIASEIEATFGASFLDLEARVKALEGAGDNALEDTSALAKASGGEVRVIGGEARPAVLVLPDPQPEGEIPLIVSLHGFGGDSFSHSSYIPLLDRVNRDGFAVLLPNGTVSADGRRFWNATGWCCDFGGASVDDMAYLTGLVKKAGEVLDVGPVYFFGHSNGGFMSYRMACEGLPGLRAVASLAGTGYLDETRCDGAAPVSVLHIHGERDEIVRFHGSEESQLPALTANERYAGAKDMYHRWRRRAGCDSDSETMGERLDLDVAIKGAETFTYRFTEGCAEGITVEMWSSDEGGHIPAYRDAFVDALLDWLLAQG